MSPQVSHVAVCPNCTMKVAEVETVALVRETEEPYMVLVELDSCSTGGELAEMPAGYPLPLDKVYRAAMRERKNHKLHVCKKADEAKAE